MNRTTSRRKPLYLDGSAGGLSVLCSGPALTVRDAQGRERWYPLRLLSRVICRGEVEWVGNALQRCWQSGVGVVVAGRDGSIAGIAVCGLRQHYDLGDRLRELASLPDWPARWESWLRGQERRLMRLTFRAFGITRPVEGVRARDARRVLLVHLVERYGEDALARLKLLDPPLQGHVLQLLREAGVDPEMIVGTRGGEALGVGFRRLLWWPVAGRALRTDSGLPRNFRQAALYYEHVLAPRLEPTIRRLVSYLWRMPLP